METIKVSIVILSHLSDVQAMIGSNEVEGINERLNFVKYLTITYENNKSEINPDVVFEEFKKNILV